eukprot:COSAG01_NODE_15238_length_1358_cov_1.820492_1_plen_34_part_00
MAVSIEESIHLFGPGPESEEEADEEADRRSVES